MLLAFGLFTNKTLDFFTGLTDLHQIYGPNEARKSSALPSPYEHIQELGHRQVVDLRF